MNAVRQTREERERREMAEWKSRLAEERRRQILGLLMLAIAVLAGTVLYVGPRNVFRPGWWRPW